MRKFKIVEFGEIKPEGKNLSFDGFSFASTEEVITNVDVIDCVIETLQNLKQKILDEDKEVALPGQMEKLGSTTKH